MFIDTPFTITRDDADLYVEHVGPEDAEVIYFLHGGPGYNSYSFRDLMGEDLESFQMLYADQRGAGRSYTDAAFTVDTLAEDVKAILATLKIPQVTLLAHGFGAMVAMRYARLYPEGVTRLILVNPWVDMPLLARMFQRQAAFMSDRKELALPPESALADAESLEPQPFLEQAFEWVTPKQLFDYMEFPDPSSRLRLEHSDTEALLGPQNNHIPEDTWLQSVKEDLDAVKLPTVVLAGQQDLTSYSEQIELVLERMPHALVSLLDAGHYPWIDDPELFTDLLKQAMQVS